MIDGASNYTELDFVTGGQYPGAYYETQRKAYTGAASGTPLVSLQTCYNNATVPCTTSGLVLPISQIDAYEVLSGLQMHGSTSYLNQWGLQTQLKTYDFGGASARGPLLTNETWTYPSSGLVGLLKSDVVTDASGNTISSIGYGL